MNDKKTLWDLDKIKIECQCCGVNCELYIFDSDILCKDCAQKEIIELDDPSDQ